jgi:hypothetical protein
VIALGALPPLVRWLGPRVMLTPLVVWFAMGLRRTGVV